MLPVMTVPTDRFSMDYITFGTGPRPFVILPGMSVTPVTPGGDAIRAAFSVFENSHTVYLFDRKRDIRRGYSVADMTDDTAEAMRALGIRDADILGTSQGGMIAQLLAARYPDLTHSITMASSVDSMNADASAVMQHWIDLARAGETQELNRDFFRRVYSAAYVAQYRDALRALEDIGTREELERFAVLAEACLSFDSRDELANITCPALVLGSKCDRTLFPERTIALAEQLHAPLYLYDGYSHAVYDEAPDFLTHIVRFFSEIAA